MKLSLIQAAMALALLCPLTLAQEIKLLASDGWAYDYFGGSVAMAKFSAKNGPPTPDSAGSQFFINFQPSPHLNGQFTVFGRVIEGMGVVTRLQPQSDEDEKKNEELIRPDRVISAKVLRKRDHEYVPHKVE